MEKNNLFFTQTRVDVTKRIFDGRTEFVSINWDRSRERADEIAKEKRSYVYNIFDLDGNFIGYGIPS